MTFEVRAPDGRVIELEQPIGDLVSTANEYVTDKFGKSSATSLLEMVQLRLTKPQRYKLLASLRVMCWSLSRGSVGFPRANCLWQLTPCDVVALASTGDNVNQSPSHTFARLCLWLTSVTKVAIASLVMASWRTGL